MDRDYPVSARPLEQFVDELRQKPVVLSSVLVLAVLLVYAFRLKQGGIR
jgi:hypothetical protein